MSNTKVPKSILFAGIIVLIAGVLTRRLFELPYFGLGLILTGVALKTYYIIAKARAGEYRPGKELWFLFVGLALFLGGIYVNRQGMSELKPAVWMATGIALKVVFIVKFIRLTRT